MPTSYTNLLGLALPVNGELSGTWGTTVNDYITQYLDASIAGTQTISGSQTAVTLSKTTNASLTQAGTGATGSSQYAVINCTGNPASMLTVTVPAASKEYIVVNATSTNQSVKIVGAGPTTGVTVVAGERCLIAWNGSDFVKIGGTNGAGTFTDLTVSGTTTLSNLTASTALALNASKEVVSVTNTGTGNNVLATSPTLTTPTLGVATATSINKVAFTAPATGSTLTIADGKTLAANNSLTLAGTDATTMTFPTTSATIARTDAAQTFTGTQTFSSNPTLSAGTANGVAYLNGSKVLTTGSALTFDGTNLGIGGSPSYKLDAISSSDVAGAIRSTGTSTSASLLLSNGNGTSSANYSYIRYFNNSASPQEWRVGTYGDARFVWQNVTAGSEAMCLTSTGLGIGTSSPGQKLEVANTGGSVAATLRSSNTGYSELYFARVNDNAAGAISYEHSSNMLRLYNGGSARVYLDSSGNLGIGTSSPGTLFHGSSGRSILTWNSTTTNNDAMIALTNSTDSSRAEILANKDGTGGATYLAVGTRNSSGSTIERARIDSSGNLGLGVTPSAWGASQRALDIGYSGALKSSTGSSSVVSLTNNAYYTTTWTYKVTGQAAALYDLRDTGEHRWYNAPSGTAGNAISFTQALTLNTNGALVLQGGDTAASGVGITFPATQNASSNANTLDDYEEGTWTPTFENVTYTASSTYTEGRYTKIGRVVTVVGVITTDSLDTSDGSQVDIGGLPFTVENVNVSYTPPSLFIEEGFNASGVDGYQAISVPGSTVIRFYTFTKQSSGDNYGALLYNQLTGGTNGTRVRFQLTYIV